MENIHKNKLKLDAKFLNETRRGNFIMLNDTFHNEDKIVMSIFAHKTIPDHNNKTRNLTICVGRKGLHNETLK